MTDLSCDLEVFIYDWFVDYYDDELNQHWTFHNDYQGVKEFMNRGDTLYGFNFKRYDRYILDAILNGKSPEHIKELNDDIIQRGIQGWESDYHRNCYAKYNFYDLMDDTQAGISLKSFEAHSGMDIVESEVDFNINRSLNKEEIEKTIYYVRQDTERTAKLRALRVDYLNTKIKLGAKCGLTREEALYCTNAKLTSKYLKASKKKFKDDREYVFPKNIDYKYIPDEVVAFFSELHNKDRKLEDVLKDEYEFNIGDCVVKIAWGGIHGAILGYYEEATEDRVILNVDGDSFYPNIDIHYNYVSRCLTDPQAYPDVVQTRVQYKHSGDEALIDEASRLKLIVNTTYGCKGDMFNDLYDLKNRISTCVTGQLLLLWLSNLLYTECKTCKVIQINTDGVMISVDKSELKLVEKLCDSWVSKSMITLDRDNISKIIQRDVNNYIEVQLDEKLKIKGGTLVRGIKYAPFNINNTAPIMSKALIEYLVHGTPIAKTINECNDIHEFQLICKASHKYDGAYHEVNGELIEVQRCNRVYATNNIKYGGLFKTQNGAYKKQTTGNMKLPEHCIVDNDNHLTIDSIYKQWYIDTTKINALKFKKTSEKVIERTEKFYKERRDYECISEIN